MTLHLDRVHTFRKKPGQSVAVLASTNPVIRVSSEDEPPIFLQGGRAYTESGKPVQKIPEWAENQIRALNRNARIEVGLERPNASGGNNASTPSETAHIDPAILELLSDPDVQKTLLQLKAIKEGTAVGDPETPDGPDEDDDPIIEDDDETPPDEDED